MLRRDRYCADLREIFPHHVQCAAACDFAVGRDGNTELLHVLIERDGGLIEQSTRSRVRVNKRPDCPDIASPRAPDRVVHPLSALPVRAAVAAAFRRSLDGVSASNVSIPKQTLGSQ